MFNTSSVYCVVCSPPKVSSPFGHHIFAALYPLHLLPSPTPFPSGNNHTVVCIHKFVCWFCSFICCFLFYCIPLFLRMLSDTERSKSLLLKYSSEQTTRLELEDVCLFHGYSTARTASLCKSGEFLGTRKSTPITLARPEARLRPERCTKGLTRSCRRLRTRRCPATRSRFSWWTPSQESTPFIFRPFTPRRSNPSSCHQSGAVATKLMPSLPTSGFQKQLRVETFPQLTPACGMSTFHPLPTHHPSRDTSPPDSLPCVTLSNLTPKPAFDLEGKREGGKEPYRQTTKQTSIQGKDRWYRCHFK